jgi:hypothetical protein
MRRALDVGTGVAGHVTGLLLATGEPVEVIAIDCPRVLERARATLTLAGHDLRAVRFLPVMLTDLDKHVPNGWATEVHLRFCLSTVGSIEPHCEDLVLAQLRHATAPGGTIDVTDYGPLSYPDTPQGALQAELWLFDKICSLWRFTQPLVEYPQWWAEAALRRAGYTVTDTERSPAHWDARWLREFEASMRYALTGLPKTLRDGAAQRLRILVAAAEACITRDGSIVNGYTYRIRAVKGDG